MNEKAKKNNKITLLLLIVIFISPLALSWYVFNYTDFLAMRGTSNKGDLIDPARPLGDLVLVDPLNDERHDSLYGKWSLVYVSRVCEDECMETVYTIRQIHSMMDKHSLRVQRVLFLTDQSVEELKEKLTDYAGQLIIDNSQIDKNLLISKFKLGKEDDPAQANRVYIIDPLGNLMMSYKSGTNPREIYKDLKKLLRASHIG